MSHKDSTSESRGSADHHHVQGGGSEDGKACYAPGDKDSPHVLGSCRSDAAADRDWESFRDQVNGAPG